MARRTMRGSGRPLTRRQRRSRQQQWLIIGTVIVVVILGAGIAYAYLSRDEFGEKFADLGNDHLEAEPAAYLWNSRPPTSGPHAPQIVAWGVHTETVPEWYQVHNLEDGGVILHYNCPEGCPEMVAELQDIVQEMGTEQLVLHPYTNMDSRIAITAWTRLLKLDEVDRDKIVEFIKAYRGIDHHK